MFFLRIRTGEKRKGGFLLNVVEKDIDVLCIFYEGEIPMPRKFKLKRKTGEITTVDVEHITRYEKLTPGGLYNIVYHCQSEVQDCIINYDLRYFVKDMKWQLYRVF